MHRVHSLRAIGTLFRALAICLMVSTVALSPAAAKGFHGMGGFGTHRGARMEQESPPAPSYLLITVSSVIDENSFKTAMGGLAAAIASFNGRLILDMDKPVAWEGGAPEHITMIRFDNPDQAQAWKNSDAFKTFDDDLHRSSESSMQLVEGLPAPADRGHRGGARFDAKVFQPNVKDYDQLLHQRLKSICKGC